MLSPRADAARPRHSFGPDHQAGAAPLPRHSDASECKSCWSSVERRRPQFAGLLLLLRISGQVCAATTATKIRPGTTTTMCEETAFDRVARRAVSPAAHYEDFVSQPRPQMADRGSSQQCFRSPTSACHRSQFVAVLACRPRRLQQPCSGPRFLDSGNADYRNQPGTLLRSCGPRSALAPSRNIKRPTTQSSLGPLLVRSLQRLPGLGRHRESNEALEHAIHADGSMTPDVAWEAGNFYLVQGANEKALREFRVVIANDPSLADQPFSSAGASNLMWMFCSATLCLPEPTHTSAFSRLLEAKEQTAGAAKVWNALMQTRAALRITAGLRLHPLFDPAQGSRSGRARLEAGRQPLWSCLLSAIVRQSRRQWRFQSQYPERRIRLAVSKAVRRQSEFRPRRIFIPAGARC